MIDILCGVQAETLKKRLRGQTERPDREARQRGQTERRDKGQTERSDKEARQIDRTKPVKLYQN